MTKLIAKKMHITVPSSYELLGIIRNAVKNYLEAEDVLTRDIYKVVSIVDELATNVVEHAYTNCMGNKTLDIELEKNDEIIFISVEDRGEGFKGEGHSKEEGGMGLNIVRGLVDSFEIMKKEHGTKVKVSKKLRRGK